MTAFKGLNKLIGVFLPNMVTHTFLDTIKICLIFYFHAHYNEICLCRLLVIQVMVTLGASVQKADFSCILLNVLSLIKEVSSELKEVQLHFLLKLLEILQDIMQHRP